MRIYEKVEVQSTFVHLGDCSSITGSIRFAENVAFLQPTTGSVSPFVSGVDEKIAVKQCEFWSSVAATK